MTVFVKSVFIYKNIYYTVVLRGINITKPNHVWSTDITYIRLKEGFVYLT